MSDSRSLPILPKHDKPGAEDLASWWEITASSDCAESSKKQREYGSDDLAEVGAELTMMAGWDDATEQVKAELGCMFYKRGKLARAMAAYRRHELPSDDTHHDDTVYSMMIRRIRAVGYWG